MAALTELAAVNELLRAVTEAPINSLEGNTNLKAQMAETILQEFKTNILAEGWHINTIKEKELEPDSLGVIYVPSETLRADAFNYLDPDVPNIVLRSNYLYNITDDTNEFDDGVICTLILDLEFEELTPALRNHITKQAKLQFITDILGQAAVSQYDIDQAQKACATAIQENLQNGDYNDLTGNNSIYDIVSRQINPRRQY